MGKRLMAIAFVSTALLAGLPATGHADGKPGLKHRSTPPRTRVAHNFTRSDQHWRRWKRDRGQIAKVPELDAGAAGHGLAILLAGAALLIDRRRRQRV